MKTIPVKFTSALVLLGVLVAAGAAIAATHVGSAPFKLSATGAGNSYAPTFSADGRHVAFISHANNLVTYDDLAPHLDLFVRDLTASNTVLVSVSTNGFGGANDNIGLFTLSSNAQVVAFETLANNLAPGDTNRLRDIYVRDIGSGTTRLLTPGANGPSSNPLISEDGQRVIFESLASNLVTNDFNGTNDIFIHDLTTGVTELVTLNADGTASPNGHSHSPSISADGLTVAFVSHATNLVEGVTNTLGEVYARKVAEGTTRWAAGSHVINLGLGIAGYSSSRPVLSADGSFVAFKTASGGVMRFDLSRETNTVSTFEVSGNPPRSNAFLFYDNPRYVKFATSDPLRPVAFSRDGRYAALEYGLNVSGPFHSVRIDFEELVDTTIAGAAGTTTNRVPVTAIISTNRVIPGGASAFGLASSVAGSALMSASGSRIALLTGAQITQVQNVLYGSPSGIFLWEESSGVARLISTNRAGVAGTSLAVSAPAISQDGAWIAWESPDGDIAGDDLNRAWDVFVRNVDTGETTLVSARHSDFGAETALARASTAGRQSLSGDGRRIAVLALDGDGISADTNRLTDAVLRDLRAGTNLAISGEFPLRANGGGVVFARPTNEVAASLLSSDGRYAVFSGGTIWGTNIFWRDLREGTNFVVTSRAIGAAPAVSPDGLLVAFEVQDASIVGTDPSLSDLNSFPDIVLRDFRNIPPTGWGVSLSTNVSVIPGSINYSTGNGPSIKPAISPDSAWVVFQSRASNLTPETGALMDYQLFARSIDAATTRRISHGASLDGSYVVLPGGATNPVFGGNARFVFFDGATNRTIYRHDMLNDMNDAGTERRLNLAVCTGCANPSPSAEGRFVAYESRPALGGITNIFFKDLDSGTVELVSVSLTGTNGNGSSFSPLLSHDARFVVFTSRASDLVPGDSNRAMDVFVRDRWTATTHCLSRNLAGTGTGNRVSSHPVLAANGRTVAFQSFASDLVAGDYNDTRDVFVVTLGGPDTDADGMEDDWEVAYFNTLARDGSGDFDHDGASDGGEFRAGTNPANDASILRVLRLTTSTAGQGGGASRRTVIVWSAVPGRRYRVEMTEALGRPWRQLGEEVVATSLSGSVTHEQDSAWVLNSREVFYRVTLVE